MRYRANTTLTPNVQFGALSVPSVHYHYSTLTPTVQSGALSVPSMHYHYTTLTTNVQAGAQSVPKRQFNYFIHCKFIKLDRRNTATTMTD